MKNIFLNAVRNSSKVRNYIGLNLYQPTNIYDICAHYGISVKFVNINMEGIYIKGDDYKSPTILLSNERPFSRRVFTCAHEFGHHFYGHGSKIDSLDYDSKYTQEQDQEELLVNAFASSLLMPIAGIQAEFVKRDLNPKTASNLDYFLISSFFGVGYHTLIYHCRINKLINYNKMIELLKSTPLKILRQYFSSTINKSHFKYIDNISQPKIIDLEISNYIIAPHETEVNHTFLKEILRTDLGVIYMSIKRGITNLSSPNFNKDIKIRIENKNYSGLSEYRHLE